MNDSYNYYYKIIIILLLEYQIHCFVISSTLAYAFIQTWLSLILKAIKNKLYESWGKIRKYYLHICLFVHWWTDLKKNNDAYYCWEWGQLPFKSKFYVSTTGPRREGMVSALRAVMCHIIAQFYRSPNWIWKSKLGDLANKIRKL